MDERKFKPQIDEDILFNCVSEQLRRELRKSELNWRMEILSEEVNFTTKGIYRISGTIHNKKWSLILKILQEVKDKLDPQHHNYWKREALVLSTTILEPYSNLFITPKCYHIEENTDGTVWLWMEGMDGHFGQSLTEENFKFIAHTLGVFNGMYLHEPSMLPSWVCRSWLDSWIKSSQHYSIQVEDYIDLVGPDLKKVIDSFLMIKKDIPHHLRMLKNSPQVLAHQDLSKGNICILDGELTLIDWQFMSVSALGEDLGKLFGVMVSQEMIPIEKIDTYRRLLLENYIIGLEDSGWTGNKETLTYAFYVSFALRSVWEVPKFVESIIQGNSDEKHSRLYDLVTYQLQTYKEACDMMNKKDEWINFTS